MVKNKSFLLRNTKTFGGISPEDLFIHEVVVTLAGSAGTIATDLAPGTVAAYAVFKRVTIAADGTAAVNLTAPTATETVDVILIAPGHTTQGGIA